MNYPFPGWPTIASAWKEKTPMKDQPLHIQNVAALENATGACLLFEDQMPQDKCFELWFPILIDGKETDSGYGFRCNESGLPLFDRITGFGLKNLRSLLLTGQPFDCRGANCAPGRVRSWINMEPSPRWVLCSCATPVRLIGFTSTCPGCGLNYNYNGRELDAPEAEETQEDPDYSPADEWREW